MASTDLPKPGFDVVLRDENGLELGLIAVNSRGDHEPTAITRDPVEQSSLKMSSGNQSYSDLRPPYTALAQADWSGGRGGNVFEDDVTRFKSSCRADTGRANKIILGGRETYESWAASPSRNQPGAMKMVSLLDALERVAKRFQAAANQTVDAIRLWVDLRDNSLGTLYVRLCADGTGKPGTVLESLTVTPANMQNQLLSEFYPFEFSDRTLTAGTYYWIEVYYAPPPFSNEYCKVGMSATAGTTKQSADDGSNWTDCAYDLYYSLRPNTTSQRGEFFQYKRQLYFVTMPENPATASTVWMNGVRGVAKSNAGAMNKLKVNGTSPGYTTNEFVDCILLLIGGDGSTEYQPWRKVTANAADEFTVDSDWLIEHDTTTEFVLLGAGSKWTQLTALTYITKAVTDVIVGSDQVVFAQGEEAGIVAMREFNSAGTWTRQQALDSSKAVYLSMFDDGGTWKWVRSNGNTTVSVATEPGAWGVPPVWGAQKSVGYTWERITGLARYATDSGAESVWVLKESGPYEFDGTTVTSKARDEMRAIIGEQFRRVASKSDVYFWMSLQNTVWRYYSPSFEDVGFMLDDGLPSEMRGNVSCILPFPGRTLVAVDAGASGYSSILENNGGSAWHMKYQAPKGERIYHMEVQVIPGSTIDRLWILQGGEMVWYPYPSNAFDPSQDTNYPYAHEGMVELGAMYAGLLDASKYWSALKLDLDDLVDDETWVEANYRLDDGNWQTMAEVFDEMPLAEHALGTVDDEDREFGANSKKFQLRVRLMSTSLYKSPLVRAIVVKAVTVTQPKFLYAFIYKIEPNNLNDAPDDTLTAGQKTALVEYGVADTVDEIGDVMTTTQKQKLLDAWSGRAQSLWMSCVIPAYHNRPVFLAPPPARPLTVSEHEGEFTYTNTIRLQEA